MPTSIAFSVAKIENHRKSRLNLAVFFIGGEKICK